MKKHRCVSWGDPRKFRSFPWPLPSLSDPASYSSPLLPNGRHAALLASLQALQAHFHFSLAVPSFWNGLPQVSFSTLVSPPLRDLSRPPHISCFSSRLLPHPDISWFTYLFTFCPPPPTRLCVCPICRHSSSVWCLGHSLAHSRCSANICGLFRSHPMSNGWSPTP